MLLGKNDESLNLEFMGYGFSVFTASKRGFVLAGGSLKQGWLTA